jgi:hypothetical protein
LEFLHWIKVGTTPIDHATVPCVLVTVFCHLYAEERYCSDCTSAEKVDFAITLSHILSLSKTNSVENICIRTECIYWTQCRFITGTHSPYPHRLMLSNCLLSKRPPIRIMLVFSHSFQVHVQPLITLVSCNRLVMDRWIFNILPFLVT